MDVKLGNKLLRNVLLLMYSYSPEPPHNQLIRTECGVYESMLSLRDSGNVTCKWHPDDLHPAFLNVLLRTFRKLLFNLIPFRPHTHKSRYCTFWRFFLFHIVHLAFPHLALRVVHRTSCIIHFASSTRRADVSLAGYGKSYLHKVCFSPFRLRRISLRKKLIEIKSSLAPR